MGLSHTNIFAKIESKEGMANFRNILPHADAMVFSRGNLGVCLEAEKMFLAQKLLLQVGATGRGCAMEMDIRRNNNRLVFLWVVLLYKCLKTCTGANDNSMRQRPCCGALSNG